MSENTNYFAVKSSSAIEVQRKLNAAKVLSVVDEDVHGYWFSAKYPKTGNKWVVVTAPSQLNVVDGEVSTTDIYNAIQDVSTRVRGIFNTVVHFQQAGNSSDWRLKINCGDRVAEKYFSLDEENVFAEADKIVFTKCFDKNFMEMETLLQSGTGADFLNFVGIPYMEMNDQNKVNLKSLNNQYSVFLEQIFD